MCRMQLDYLVSVCVCVCAGFQFLFSAALMLLSQLWLDYTGEADFCHLLLSLAVHAQKVGMATNFALLKHF